MRQPKQFIAGNNALRHALSLSSENGKKVAGTLRVPSPRIPDNAMIKVTSHGTRSVPATLGRLETEHLRPGFTLIELLVVVAIIALLLAILLPSLGRAKEQAKSVQCLSNLRQMATAAFSYAAASDSRFPIAYYTAKVNVGGTLTRVSVAWDSMYPDVSVSPPANRSVPGLLWQGGRAGGGGGVGGGAKVQQCPNYLGGSNWGPDYYTGYNYNTTYIGHGDMESIAAPVHITALRKPASTALFGDGQYYNGANKFMRAPQSALDVGMSVTPDLRASGTQGYRHLGKTNVAFGDGHGESMAQRYTNVPDPYPDYITPDTGFLSFDNALYSLE